MARFFRRGVTKVKFLPAVAASTLIPTRAEIAAGTDLSPDLAEIGGWTVSNSPIPTPDLAHRFTSNIPGEDTVDDSTVTFYDRDDAELIRTAVAKDTEGFIAIFPYGDVPAKRMEVFPVRVASNSDEISTGNDPARFVVGFSITDEPNLDVTIPAAA